MRMTWKKLLAPALAGLVLATTAGAAQAPVPAPGFTLPARGGGTIDLSKYKGQVVMINFWASWCGPCRQEMPLLENIYQKYGKQGFTLLGVSIDDEAKTAEEFLKKTPVSFPVLFDTQSKVSGLYQVQGMPTSIFIDRKGNVRLVHESYKPGDENGYLDEIRSLVRE